MFCSKCGKDLTGIQGSFCPDCGTKIGGVEDKKETAEAKIFTPNTGTKRKKFPAKILIAVVAVLIIGAGVFVFFGRNTLSEGSSGSIVEGSSGSEVKKGDRIYYINDADIKIYSRKTDGSDNRKLTDDKTVNHITVAGDRIYYINQSDSFKIYTIKTDGSDNRKLTNDMTLSDIIAAGDRVYYRNGDDDKKLYTIKTDGSDRRKLTDDRADSLTVVGKRIHYKNSSDGKRYSMKLDGSDMKLEE